MPSQLMSFRDTSLSLAHRSFPARRSLFLAAATISAIWSWLSSSAAGQQERNLRDDLWSTGDSDESSFVQGDVEADAEKGKTEAGGETAGGDGKEAEAGGDKAGGGEEKAGGDEKEAKAGEEKAGGGEEKAKAGAKDRKTPKEVDTMIKGALDMLKFGALAKAKAPTAEKDFGTKLDAIAKIFTDNWKEIISIKEQHLKTLKTASEQLPKIADEAAKNREYLRLILENHMANSAAKPPPTAIASAVVSGAEQVKNPAPKAQAKAEKEGEEGGAAGGEAKAESFQQASLFGDSTGITEQQVLASSEKEEGL